MSEEVDILGLKIIDDMQKVIVDMISALPNLKYKTAGLTGITYAMASCIRNFIQEDEQLKLVDFLTNKIKTCFSDDSLFTSYTPNTH